MRDRLWGVRLGAMIVGVSVAGLVGCGSNEQAGGSPRRDTGFTGIEFADAAPIHVQHSLDAADDSAVSPDSGTSSAEDTNVAQQVRHDAGSASADGSSAVDAAVNPPPPVLVHLQGTGDVACSTGQWCGTKGESRRLEGFAIRLPPGLGDVQLKYFCHLQGTGDTAWQAEGSFCGTRGQSRRLEGFALALSGDDAAKYSIGYQAHVQNMGDTAIIRNGGFAGTRGQSLRVEAIKVWLEAHHVKTLVHLQDIGDVSCYGRGWCGTRGEARRLEGFSMKLDDSIVDVQLQYMCHLQGTGDTAWLSEGSFCGTRGQSRRLEGFAVRLTGARAHMYHVAYQAHLQDIGDTGVVSNGGFIGTRGQSRRLEALRIWLQPKEPTQ